MEHPTAISVGTKQKDRNSMFKINATFELQTISATSEDGSMWETAISFDSQPAHTIMLSHDQLGWLMQFNLHPDGEPEGHEAKRASLEPMFVGIPRELWPLP
jgi:hypothetical protein